MLRIMQNTHKASRWTCQRLAGDLPWLAQLLLRLLNSTYLKGQVLPALEKFLEIPFAKLILAWNMLISYL